MVPLNEFRAENNEIRDLCTVLGLTIDQKELMGNTIVCELLNRFSTRVSDHLMHEDRLIYHDLLKKHTPEANKIADQFIGNTIELKRIFGFYKRDWCMKKNNTKQHEKYAAESKDIFKLVCDRINFEEEKIFPHFE